MARKKKVKRKEPSPEEHNFILLDYISTHRKRIVGWGTAVVMTFGIPTARDQAYFRDNPYIIPALCVATAILYLALLSSVHWVSSFIAGISVGCKRIERHRWLRYVPARIGMSLSLATVIVGFLAILWSLTLSASISHLANLHKVPLQECSMVVGENSEVVARVHSRSDVQPPGKTSPKVTSFQDLFQDFTINLIPNGRAVEVTVLIQDQRKPTDHIRVLPPGNAVIGETRNAWMSGFEEPSHLPEFFTRTVTFAYLSEPTIITLRRSIRGHTQVSGATDFDLDLDVDRTVKVTAHSCNLTAVPVLDRKIRLERLAKELQTLKSRKEEGPDGFAVGITRHNPDDPIPPLTVNEMELRARV